MMGESARIWKPILVVLALMVVNGFTLTVPPTSTPATKRTDENIQFGNQQNKPVGVLDEDVLPGSFPSSETVENEVEGSTYGPKDVDGHNDDVRNNTDNDDDNDDNDDNDDDHDDGQVNGVEHEGKDDHHEQEEQEDKTTDKQEYLENGFLSSSSPSSSPSTFSSSSYSSSSSFTSPPSLSSHKMGHHHAMHPDIEAVTQSLKSHRQRQRIPVHREEMIRDLPPVALATRWRSPPQMYGAQEWSVPMSPLYGELDNVATFPSRRRRSTNGHHRRSSKHSDPRKHLGVSLATLRTGHRHKRETYNLQDLRRMRRDLPSNDVDLEKFLQDMDVVKLLTMLSMPPLPLPMPQSNGYVNPNYPPVYAPRHAGHARYAPPPKFYPDDDDDGEDIDDEDDGEVNDDGDDVDDDNDDDVDDDNDDEGYYRHQAYEQTPSRVASPYYEQAFGRQSPWKRSKIPSYGSLSMVPGFKRSSAFRANRPRPPAATLHPSDVYSLAAMLGAELDPVTHRLRRAAM